MRIVISLSLKSISYLHTKMQLLMLYKIVHKLVELPLPDNIYYSYRSTRGNELKFIMPQTTINSYKYNFPQINKPMEQTSNCTLSDFSITFQSFFQWKLKLAMVILRYCNYIQFCEFYNNIVKNYSISLVKQFNYFSDPFPQQPVYVLQCPCVHLWCTCSVKLTGLYTCVIL